MKQKTKRTIGKYLALLFTMAILLASQGIPAQAEKNTPNEAGKQQAKTKELPSNPAHHCPDQYSSRDYTDWSYIYFGSYPQTEVTGDSLTPAITGASYDSNGDALADGVKYRRISKGDTNYNGHFGDSDYRYFKWEPIKWRVLQNNGSTLFVIADQGLDCKDYHEEYTFITWEDSTLRNWLNNSFYHTAFSSKEQEAVVSQTIANKKNPEYGTEGGNKTNDNVYLLSMGEASNPSYGFCKDYDTNSESRLLKPSDYAHAMGAYTGIDESACSCWWLRSPGSTADSAATILNCGYVHRNGCSVNTTNSTVAPVLHINLSSDLWSLAKD